ncbi:MAG: RcnB family protein [Alphaproteobacteria bacterium]|nr:RcnB family protein [Alphaproteobacteria bacterium]MBU1515793.1 RcnB family protein [Alphaproteobacteria bacterium]MBU2094015.1 RcnB family protein [Alphaproteobacteria bacterium]MBU2152614.1 RcnB family protein [Alphaproteobacteria bacterium]MBU2308839.1 RcnB family protein [Alphaproteobacteria bacterium]
MKRLLTGAIALSLLAGSTAMAQPRNDRHDDHRYDRRDDRRGDHRAHNWSKGQRLPAEYRGRGAYVDYRQHHLRQPPRGYQWVRVDNNYMMVALTSGLIASIIASQN